MKACSKCRSKKNGYYADPRASDGLQSQCKVCMNAKSKRLYARQQAARAAYNRDYYRRHRAEILNRMSKNYLARHRQTST